MLEDARGSVDHSAEDSSSHHRRQTGRAKVCKAMNPSSEDARGIAMKLHLNWGYASAHQLKRILADALGGRKKLAAIAEDVAEQRRARRTLVRP